MMHESTVETLMALFGGIKQEWRICDANDCNTLSTRIEYSNYSTGARLEHGSLFLNFSVGNRDGTYPERGLQLEHYLKQYFNGEIEGEPTCDICGTQGRPAAARAQLIDGPEILVFGLQQVVFNPSRKKHGPPLIRVKDPSVVQPSMWLHLDQFMPEASRTAEAKARMRYMLSGVIIHLGKDAGYGHYVAYVRKGGQWWDTNDEDIDPADISNVLRAAYPGGAAPAPTMFFYQRAPLETTSNSTRAKASAARAKRSGKKGQPGKGAGKAPPRDPTPKRDDDDGGDDAPDKGQGKQPKARTRKHGSAPPFGADQPSPKRRRSGTGDAAAQRGTRGASEPANPRAAILARVPSLHDLRAELPSVLKRRSRAASAAGAPAKGQDKHPQAAAKKHSSPAPEGDELPSPKRIRFQTDGGGDRRGTTGAVASPDPNGDVPSTQRPRSRPTTPRDEVVAATAAAAESPPRETRSRSKSWSPSELPDYESPPPRTPSPPRMRRHSSVWRTQTPALTPAPPEVSSPERVFYADGGAFPRHPADSPTDYSSPPPPLPPLPPPAVSPRSPPRARRGRPFPPRRPAGQPRRAVRAPAPMDRWLRTGTVRSPRGGQFGGAARPTMTRATTRRRTMAGHGVGRGREGGGDDADGANAVPSADEAAARAESFLGSLLARFSRSA
jgi:hypothetical protein